ncbi:MAG: lycopene cyclase domain-containing protein [Candidatus Uhrbacteria bacterium]|nr:hypothetical protein [Patescibacteria group bacterium]MBU1907027.1 hypothetical protein [Patescibacteria group bacterium]
MQYAWFIWTLILLGIWVVVFLSLRDKISRKEMLLVSAWTSLAGLLEPVFVPEYWNPPSLFDLAARTGFDIESIIFSFVIGGLVVVLYELIFKTKHQKIRPRKKLHPRHQFHLWALLSAPIVFFLLIIFTDLNPIYSTFIALMGGGIFTWYCRPDLKKKMMVSAFIFLIFYYLYFLSLILMFPGYVEQVWNLEAISGIIVLGVPLEELMFAFGLGFLWSSVYEHAGWYKIKSV